jgi:predicted extracellular nuclease
MASRSSAWVFGVGLAIGAGGAALLGVAFLLAQRGSHAAPPTTPDPTRAASASRPTSSRPTPAPAGAGTFRVATWNIEWLGKPASRHSKVAQTPDDIAGYVATSQADVVALNEVTGDAADGTENATLRKATEALRGLTGSEWRHVLFPKENKAERDQLTGVLWNVGRAQLVGVPFRIPVRRPPGHDELWNRHPYAVKFSSGEGRTDVVLVPVHLKSNRGGKDTTSVQRADEARGIVRALGAVQNHFSDDDVIVLGDCNCLKANEPALVRFVGGGLRDLNADDTATWIKDERFPAAPFDRVFVPDDQPEFKASTLKVVRPVPPLDEAEFRRRVSDHLMVTADIRTQADDD